MKIFSPMYDMVMRWSRHQYAEYYLAAMSFIESIFWPIPVDVMLAPMALGRTDRAWRFAFLATIFSVLGAAVGYALGYYFEPMVMSFADSVGYAEKMDVAKAWFETWGVLVIFVASFTPIPYKVFTITAGVMSMALLPFLAVSLIGRGLRFFLVAGLMKWGGAVMEEKLRRYVDVLGWLVIAAAIIAYLLLR